MSTKATTSLDRFTPEQLLQGCRQTKPDDSHEGFCLEMFRRAIEEHSEACWAVIYQQYQKLVYRWTIDFAHTNDHIGDTTVDEMVLDAFTSFWRAFTADKLAKATRLASVLAYLKSCAATSVLQAKRKAEQEALRIEWQHDNPDDQLARLEMGMRPETEIITRLTADQLWAIVDNCCHNEQERVVARLSFVSNLKPRSILIQFPDLFTDSEEIYAIRRNLKNRLWRDEQLQTLHRL
ncbi:MAG: hypothetical protein R3C14_24850 [Caldilineaceae bacterium]